MFSRGPAASRVGSSPHISVRKGTKESPIDELIACLDRMEFLVAKTRNNWQEKSKTPAKDKKAKSGSYWRRSTPEKNAEKEEEKKPVSPYFIGKTKEQRAEFLPMDAADKEELVEVLRRTAELVVMGERGAAKAQSERDKQIKKRMENPDDEDEESEEEDDRPSFESCIALFEHFFERNALSLIVTIVTGAAFLPSSLSREASISNMSDASLDFSATQDEQLEDTCTMLPPLPIATQAVQSVSILIQNVSRATSLYFLLSNNHINELINLPLERYTLAEQQKRGDNASGLSTRKYSSPELAELSTHFVSFLKSLAMRMNKETLQFFLTYPAERSGHDFNASTTASSAYFSQDDTYGSKRNRKAQQKDDDRPLDEVETNRSAPVTNDTGPKPVVVPEIKVEFPLYARALEFCSVNQDSFVRVTAMNICLNTLRLACVCDKHEDEPGVSDSPSRSSPDGVLHNAEPLPIRERLAIAQHVCAPSRVEGLVSPIFTKLAQLWGILEELIRQVDSPAGGRSSAPSSGNFDTDDPSYKRKLKTEKAKQEVRKSRLSDSVKDTVANLQDELLLLDDVFKVGLTSLNEQIIEMMLATFVYPLLLQPLLSFMQRSSSDLSSGRSQSSSVNPFSVDSLSASLAQSGLLGNESEGTDSRYARERSHHDTAPAKTAFFALAAVFHLVSNQPLLRLLLTALFHPLAPEASGDSMIRAKPDVACSGPDGSVSLRLDKPCNSDDAKLVPNDRSTYLFGKLTGRRFSGNQSSSWQSNGTSEDETCVFVMSPALAGVLESSGSELLLISKTRPNPYRRAILSCVGGTGSLSALTPLAVMSVDAALSRFNGAFVSELLFGTGMRTFANDIPMDERRTDTRIVRDRHDRDIGGAGAVESRRALPSGGSEFYKGDSGSNYNNDIVSSLCVSVLSSSSSKKGTWALEFDRVAAHALLCAIRGNLKAMQTTTKMIERRRLQTASFLVQLPSQIEGATSLTRPDQNAAGSKSMPDDEEHRLGTIMNRVFYEPVGSDTSVIEDLLRFKGDAGGHRDTDNYLVAIALESSFDDLSETICSFGTQADSSETKDLELLTMAANCSRAYLQLDAFTAFVQDFASTNGKALRNTSLAGFAISRNGSMVATTDCFENDIRRTLFAPISQSLGTTLIKEREEGVPSHRDRDQPKPGSVVGLVGRTAFPCVCEVPASNASLFAENVSCVVSEGVKWQSLYLVFLGGYMILAEPEKGGSGGNGRIITSCSLSRLKVDRDHTIPVQSGSPARRLLLSHDSFETEPPSLFLFEEKPAEVVVGPFVRVQSLRSCVDLWFEDETSVERAAKVLDIKIAKARARRGNRLREKLAAGR